MQTMENFATNAFKLPLISDRVIPIWGINYRVKVL
jgi:hypothetical protein